MTAAERKAAERRRKKEAGLIRCEVWVKPECAGAVKAFAENLSPAGRPKPKGA